MKKAKPTMANTMVPNNQHKDIPGNPSTAKSSAVKLRQEATEDSLRVLTIEQWQSWKENGYVIIKDAVPREQAERTAAFLWEFEDKNPDDQKTWYTGPRAEMKMKELAGAGNV